MADYYVDGSGDAIPVDLNVDIYKGVPPLPPVSISVQIDANWDSELNSPPVTLSDIKSYLRVDTDDEDAVLTGMLAAAVSYVQEVTNTIIVKSSVTVKWADFPSSGVKALGVPVGLYENITPGASSLTYPKTDGTTGSLSFPPLSYRTHGTNIAINVGTLSEWPNDYDRTHQNSVVLVMPATSGSAINVPSQLSAAIKMLVAHWYVHREGIACGSVSNMPYGLQALLQNCTFYGAMA